MNDTKPRLKLSTIAGRPVTVEPADKLAQARKRHGKPFAFESGSTWRPREVPLLTEWLQGRGRK